MPVADYETYKKMLESAQEGGYAYPAINISSMVTANAALKGLAEQKSDGILQVSTGAGQFASGLHLKDSVFGAITLAEHIHRTAERYDVTVALHTDHCQADKIDPFLIPLIEESERRVAAGKLPLFSSHMFDGSALPLDKNMEIAVPLFRRMAKIDQILEVEAGVVGGEEEGAAGSEDTPPEDLYTTPEDMVEVYRKLSPVGGTFMFAATFGNVHGHYKPGAVKLRPEILKNGQDALQAAFGGNARFHLVFHGGSGSPQEKIRETLGYGVVKMNIDTDTQYAFTRPIVDHMMTHYNEVLMVDGEIGNKKKYDPRSYLKAAEEAMSRRVARACDDLLSAGKSISAA